MNAAEAGMLLGTCAAIDQRTTGEADALAWQMALSDLDFADCELAVIAHYSESEQRIMPVHVRRRVLAMRADRIDRAPVPEIPDELADNPRAFIAAQRAAVRRAADGAHPRAIGGRP